MSDLVMQSKSSVMRKLFVVASSAAIFLAVLGLIGWISGYQLLASIRPQYIPMAPSTAVCFLVLGMAWLFQARKGSRATHLVLCVSAIIIVIAVGVVSLLEWAIFHAFYLESLVIPKMGLFDKVPLGRMAPLTAGLFVVTGGAMFLSLVRSILVEEPRFIGHLSGLLGSAVVLSGFTVLLGYMHGTPLLYGREIIPVAATTACAFLLLGFAVLARLGPDDIPNRYFMGPSLNCRLVRVFVPIILLAAFLQGFVDLIGPLIGKDDSTLLSALIEATICVLAVIATYEAASIVGSDIKRANDALTESTERFRTLIRASGSVIILVGPDLRIEEFNDEAQRVYCRQREELLGADLLELVAGEDSREIMAQEAVRVWDGRPTRRFENSVKIPGGDERIVLWSFTRLAGAAGQPTGLLASGMDITERKRSEDAIRESERRYRLLFDNMLEGFAYCKMLFHDGQPQDFVYLDVNAAFGRLTGLKEVVGKKVTELIPGIRESNPEALEIYGRVALTGNPERFETYVEPLGHWFSVSAYSTTREHFVAVFDIITRRKRAEEALRDSEERFRTLADGAFEGVVISRNGFFLDCNKVFCEISGLTLEELVGRSIRDMVAPEFENITMKYVLSGSEEACESAFVHKNGHVIPVLLKGKTIPYEGGTARIASVRDISAARRAQEVQRRLATAIEQSAEAVFITDTEGIIHYVNPAIERITGFRCEELLGKTPRVFKSGEHDAAFYRQLWDTIKTGSIWSGRFVNRRKDGSLFHADSTISPVRNASGKITNFVAVNRDVSEHLQLSSQLLQAQKMEAVGTLAGGVAHDFNNLLQVVLGYSELVITDEDLPDRFRDDLEKVLLAARNGADLVQRLLTFSRKTEPKPLDLDLNQRIRQTRKFLQRTVPKMIDIEVILEEDLRVINADPTQMDQILMNLSVNARDAMLEGGKLVIETANVIIDEDYGKSHLEAKPGRYVLLRVSDTGSGMDKETVEHIFEPFYTTKGPGQGTGLGLAMVFGIVKQHKGFINCYSEVGCGTTFKIYLPAVIAETRSDQPVVASMPGGGTETILLVDDDELTFRTP